MLIGQRSRSQFALKFCAEAVVKSFCVQPITLYCMVGFENYVAQMIIMTRQCVACKNLVARSDVNICKPF